VGRTAGFQVKVEQEFGPSPRTWGEPPHNGKRRGELRTIPTHVGRT